MALLKGICTAFIPDVMKVYFRAQGTHVVEIVRKGPKGTQVFGDLRALPNSARHQEHQGRNRTTVHRHAQNLQAYELNRTEPSAAVCRVSLLQRPDRVSDESTGRSFESEQALDYRTAQLTQTQKYS